MQQFVRFGRLETELFFLQIIWRLKRL